MKILEKESNVQPWKWAQFYWLCSGILFVVYLVLAEYLVGAICPLCTVIHIFVIIEFYITYNMISEIPSYLSPLRVIKSLHKWVLVAIIIFLVTALYYNVNSERPMTSEELVQCMNEKMVKFYGSMSCNVCLKQKAEIGDAFEAYNYFVNCGGIGSECSSENIIKWPTFVRKDGKRNAGLLSRAALAKFVGC